MRISFAVRSFLYVVIFSMFSLSLLLLNSETLPDFDSYLKLFELEDKLDGRFLALSMVFLFFNEVGLSYDLFRLMVMMTGVFFCIMLLNTSREIPRWGYALNWRSIRHIIMFLLLAFVLIVEFYLVRLRGGISILFFFIGFNIVLINYRFKFTDIINIFFAVFCFALSAFAHNWTFLILMAFLFPPLVWSRLRQTKLANGNTLYAFLCFAIWLIVFWMGVVGSTEIRGEYLASALNPTRFFAISVIPILMWAVVWVYHRRDFTSADSRGGVPYLFALNYMLCAITLAFLYFLDKGGSDGEAIVRTVTLSSVGAAICIARWGIDFRNLISVYLLLCNSLFFINTIYF